MNSEEEDAAVDAAVDAALQAEEDYLGAEIEATSLAAEQLQRDTDDMRLGLIYATFYKDIEEVLLMLITNRRFTMNQLTLPCRDPQMPMKSKLDSQEQWRPRSSNFYWLSILVLVLEVSLRRKLASGFICRWQITIYYLSKLSGKI